MNNNDIALDNYRRFSRASRKHGRYVARAQKFDRYYRGFQWSDEDKATLESKGRPALTFNKLFVMINTLLGEQISREASVYFKASKAGNEDVAEALNKIFIHEYHRLRYTDVEELVFTDALIQERGYVDIRISTEHNVFGGVEMKVLDPICVIPDVNSRSPRVEDWSELFISTYMTVADIEATYGPKKAKAVAVFIDAPGERWNDSQVINHGDTARFGNDFGETLDSFDDTDNIGMDDDAAREYAQIRVVERQYVKYEHTRQLQHPKTGDCRTIPEAWTDNEVEALSAKFGYYVVKRRVKRVYQTVTAGDVVIYDGPSAYRSYTVRALFPFFRPGDPISPLRNLVDVQNAYNKAKSQVLHIVNTTANSGWVVKRGSLTNMTVDELSERGAETGLVVEFKGDDAPSKILPNQVPNGVANFANETGHDIHDISGVSTAMMGTEENDRVSGVALESRRQGGLTPLKPANRAVERFRRSVAVKVLELIQDFYTEERVFSITDDMLPGQTEESQITVNEITPEGDIINDITLGEYAVGITQMPARDSYDDVQFAEVIQMREAGIPIPAYIAVQHSNLARRREVADMVKQLEGLGETTPEQEALAQAQMQFQMQQMQLQLREMQAKAMNQASQGALNVAKAESLAGYNEMQLRMAEMQLQLDMQRESLGMRRAMSNAGHRVRLHTADQGNASKLALTAINAANQRELAGMAARNAQKHKSAKDKK